MAFVLLYPCPHTCSWSVSLAKVSRWWHRWHHKVERDRNVHSSDMAGASTNHPDLVMGLEVHVGWAPWGGEEKPQ